MTDSNNFVPFELRGIGLQDLELRIKAVETATAFYKNIIPSNLNDYNEKINELINKIYTFYVTNKELH